MDAVTDEVIASATQPAQPKPFPISEIFTSLQGEGMHTGRLMTFVRLAGCNVGKSYTPDARAALGLNVYQTKCVSWLGTGFACDTDYRAKFHLTAQEILEHELVRDAGIVLLTGGEPLMHAGVHGLVMKLLNTSGPTFGVQSGVGRRVHIETSGTYEVGGYRDHPRCWVCVSPKMGCLATNLHKAHEIKVLVGHDFDEAIFEKRFGAVMDRVCVQPISGEYDIDLDNRQRCVELVHHFPQVRMSEQMHKIWRVR